MNYLTIRKKLCGTALLAIFAAGMSACDSWVYDDLDPCTVTYRLKFRYDHNMKYADAFPAEVNSVNVWAFDSDGHLAWKGEAAGDRVASPDFHLEMELPPGIYDFVAWCGLTPTCPFKISNSLNPVSPRDLTCTMQLSDGSEGKYINHAMENGLYHGYLGNVELKADPVQHVVQDVTIPLIKNTNELQVILQHINGTPIGRTDFSVSVTGANSFLDWDNSVMPGEEFRYTPWSVVYGSTDMNTASTSTRDTQTSVSTLLSEISVSRLLPDREQTLSVVRNTDGREIIRIPLIQYLLLVKGNYHKDLSDGEYLDRQDEHSLVFFLTEDNDWYSAGGIYINNWAVVPPQENEF